MSCGWARSHRCAKKEPRKTLKDFEQKHHRASASQATLRGLKNCLATMSNFSLFFFLRERDVFWSCSDSQSCQLGRSSQNESCIQLSDVIMGDEPRHFKTLPRLQERAPRRIPRTPTRSLALGLPRSAVPSFFPTHAIAVSP